MKPLFPDILLDHDESFQDDSSQAVLLEKIYGVNGDRTQLKEDSFSLMLVQLFDILSALGFDILNNAHSRSTSTSSTPTISPRSSSFTETSFSASAVTRSRSNSTTLIIPVSLTSSRPASTREVTIPALSLASVTHTPESTSPTEHIKRARSRTALGNASTSAPVLIPKKISNAKNEAGTKIETTSPEVAFHAAAIDVIKKLSFLQMRSLLSDNHTLAIDLTQSDIMPSLNTLISSLGALDKPSHLVGLYQSLERVLAALLTLYKSVESQYKEIHQRSTYAALTILTGTKLSFRLLEQHVARILIGVDEFGKHPVTRNSSHFVLGRGGAHYKTADARDAQAVPKEFFVQQIFFRLFQNSDSFITPTASLRLSGVIVAGDKPLLMAPQKMNASLTRDSVSYYDWIIIIKLLTHMLSEQNGEEMFKVAMRRWITKDYINEKLTSRTQLDIALYACKLVTHSDEPEGAVLTEFRVLLLDIGLEKFYMVCAFMLTWPELVAGFRIFELAKWVPTLHRLPEIFLNISLQDLHDYMATDGDLTPIITSIHHQLLEVWMNLDLSKCIPLVTGELIVNMEDGSEGQYIVEFRMAKLVNPGVVSYRIENWWPALIDIGEQVLDNAIVTNYNKPAPIVNARSSSPSLSTAPSPATPPKTPRTPKIPKTSSLPLSPKATDSRHRLGLKTSMFLPFFSERYLRTVPISSYISFIDTPEMILLKTLAACKIRQPAYEQFLRLQAFDKVDQVADDSVDKDFYLHPFHPEDLPAIYKLMKKILEFKTRFPNGTFANLVCFVSPLLACAYQEAVTRHPVRLDLAYVLISLSCLEEYLTLDAPLFPQTVSPRSPSASPKSTRSMLSALQDPSQTIRKALEACTNESRVYKNGGLTVTEALFEIVKEFPWDNPKTSTKEMLDWLKLIFKYFPELTIDLLPIADPDNDRYVQVRHEILKLLVKVNFPEKDSFTAWLTGQNAMDALVDLDPNPEAQKGTHKLFRFGSSE